MSKFLTELLIMSLGGSLTALLLLTLRRLLRTRVRPVVFYYLWLAVLLRLCLPVQGLLRIQPLPDSPAESYGASASTDLGNSVLVTSGNVYATSGGVYATSGSVYEATAELPESNGAYSVAAPTPHSVNWTSLCFWVWAAGAAFSVLYNILGYALFTRQVRRSAYAPSADAKRCFAALCPRGDVALCCSAAAPVPLLMGLRRPSVVLPARDIALDELPTVLGHELLHRRRGDLYYKWLAMLVLSLHWFNPLCLLIRAELDRDCELSCDAALIAFMSPPQRQRYGEMLIRLSATRSLPIGIPATTLSSSREHLRERLVQIMGYRGRSAAATALALLCALLLGGCAAAVGSAAATPTEASTETPVDGIEMPYATSGNVLPAEEFSVSTVDELLAALGKHSSIVLQSGVYDLSEATVGYYSNCYWMPLSGGGHQLIIQYLYGLSLRGEGDVVIRVGGSGVPVLESCSSLNLQNLRFEVNTQLATPLLTLSDCYNIYFGFCSFVPSSTDAALFIDKGSGITLSDCSFAPSSAVALGAHSTSYLYLENIAFASPAANLSFCWDTFIRGCTVDGRPLTESDLMPEGYDVASVVLPNLRIVD